MRRRRIFVEAQALLLEGQLEIIEKAPDFGFGIGDKILIYHAVNPSRKHTVEV